MRVPFVALWKYLGTTKRFRTFLSVGYWCYTADSWQHCTQSPSSKQFKSRPSAGKHLLTVFWDSQGPSLEHYVEKCVTVTSVNCCNMLRNELRPAIAQNGEELTDMNVTNYFVLTVSRIETRVTCAI